MRSVEGFRLIKDLGRYVLGALHDASTRQAQLESILREPTSPSATPPFEERRIKIPSLHMSVSRESLIGRVLEPIKTHGGEISVDEELEAAHMSQDELQEVADKYTGIVVIDRNRGVVSSPWTHGETVVDQSPKGTIFPSQPHSTT